MTAALVVPTLPDRTTVNRPLERLFGMSCERRVKVLENSATAISAEAIAVGVVTSRRDIFWTARAASSLRDGPDYLPSLIQREGKLRPRGLVRAPRRVPE